MPSPGDERPVRYHANALGRGGYGALDLVTGSPAVDTFTGGAQTVLAALDHNPGKRYQDVALLSKN